MTSYDKLRYSFDNILKELDDICKGIDDIAESFPDKEIDSTVHTQSFTNASGITNFNINNSSFSHNELEEFYANENEENVNCLKKNTETNQLVCEKEDHINNSIDSQAFLSKQDASHHESIEINSYSVPLKSTQITESDSTLNIGNFFFFWLLTRNLLTVN